MCMGGSRVNIVVDIGPYLPYNTYIQTQLENLMDSMYIHTKKGIRSGWPADRLFLVVGYNKKNVIAWKCTITKNGIEHPGYKKPISLEKLVNGKGRHHSYPNGSEATAFFKPDSLYKEITFADLEKLIKGIGKHEFTDSVEFTDAMVEVEDHLMAAQRILNDPRFFNWIKATDFNYSSDGIVSYHNTQSQLNSAVITYVMLSKSLDDIA